MNTFSVSIIIPVYSEEKNISPLLKRILPIVKEFSYEIVFIDDGSQDKTVAEIKKFSAKNKNIKLIVFSRNFGHQMALTAGYENVRGDCVISMDSDLQDPPEIIPQMIRAWQKGAKVVYAKREKRNVDGFIKRMTAHFFYKLMNFLSDFPIPQEVGDFRLLDREVVEYLNGLGERSRFLRGLVAWSGQPAAFVLFQREKRYSGSTHYTFSKMLNFALVGITSFSTKPLRMATYFGFLVSGLSVLIILTKSVQHFVFNQGDWLPGWASLFFSIVFLGGVQLITIGIIGEYIGKIYQEVQKRPQFVVKEKVNID